MCGERILRISVWQQGCIYLVAVIDWGVGMSYPGWSRLPWMRLLPGGVETALRRGPRDLHTTKGRSVTVEPSRNAQAVESR